MLQMRPDCQYGDRDIPSCFADARISTFEGTFFSGWPVRPSGIFPNSAEGFPPKVCEVVA